eukprot:4152062-Amphidinium_carterae.2
MRDALVRSGFQSYLRRRNSLLSAKLPHVVKRKAWCKHCKAMLCRSFLQILIRSIVNVPCLACSHVGIVFALDPKASQFASARHFSACCFIAVMQDARCSFIFVDGCLGEPHLMICWNGDAEAFQCFNHVLKLKSSDLRKAQKGSIGGVTRVTLQQQPSGSDGPAFCASSLRVVSGHEAVWCSCNGPTCQWCEDSEARALFDANHDDELGRPVFSHPMCNWL